MDGNESKSKEAQYEHYVPIYKIFWNRGRAIFACGEVFLLSRGFSHKDLDAMSTKVGGMQKRSDDELNFSALLKDLKNAGYNEAAQFVEKYLVDGNEKLIYPELLQKFGLPEEKFGGPLESKVSPTTKQIAEKQEAKEMETYALNILQNPELVLNKMAEVEGERWRKEEEDEKKKPSLHDQSFYGVLESFRKGQDSAGVIYGAGGWHRYIVSENGDVRFSSYHSHKEGIEKAKKAGFKV